ncbi:hypothetical protein [Ulvibacter litoralis]|uniref:Cell wall anchor protein n=1 Tax=Ulvibacter litoralis TaxID=227084 RepID=A0A1G7CK35_9FLAO|nr:hypothetical protein [Ulvibacter litoralis]GHC47076.1 hypothetical protein GCM10008083_07750 [Ulvibacter litoralis]SDE39601.1 hypothetical protein SAMN05421855_101422 [Ulvibacter litoralis]
MKIYKFPLLLIVLFFSIHINAQVGIGTTDPDSSSILDMSSTTQGVLTPRMTTTQRNDISSPADGLMVFDIDEDAFYFFNNGAWFALEGAKKRTNYKLVQSVADLADELAVGGTTKYVLNEDYLYEINGVILFDHPIDLNGAYIRGQDTGGDVIVNNSGSTLFSGSKGGHIRDVLINGNGAQVFNITASTADNLVMYSVITMDASSIGTLSGFGLVFIDVAQFLNNDDGLAVSNINSFFAQTIFWPDTNEGTFLTFSGTFDNLQIANGRIVVDATETGIDVSANPTITNAASLTGVSFVGAGTFVDGYSSGGYPGYNFGKDWDVDCQGILVEKDGVATGDINLDAAVGVGETTSFANNSTPVKISGGTSNNNLFRFKSSGDNRIIYDGKNTRYFNVSSTISCQSSGSGIYIFYIAKGNSGSATASIISETKVYRRFDTGSDIGAVTTMGAVQLAPGDFIEVWAQRYSGSSNLLTVSLNLVAN